MNNFDILKDQKEFAEEVNDMIEFIFKDEKDNYENKTETCWDKKEERNLVDEMLFEEDEMLKDQKEFAEEVNDMIEFIFEGKEEEESEIENSSIFDKYLNYNKLTYQNQTYYVKKKNYEFPVYVMNENLDHVGIILENDLNNIKMI